MGADSIVQEVGWPFLVAAGRVRDYSVLIAPDFLVASGEQGLLGIAGSAVEGAPVESRSVRTPSGRVLNLSYAARLLTPADLGAGSGDPADGRSVVDEFGRPLRMVVGMVTDGGTLVDPTADLARAERAVLPAYRRFWADEAAYRVEPSPGEPVRSFGRIEPPPPVPAPAPVPYAAAPLRPQRRVPSPALLVVAAVIALLVVALLLVRPWSPTGCPSPVTATTTTTTTTSTTTTTKGNTEVAGPNRVAAECP